MKITRIDVHQIDLPLREGKYSWSGGKSIGVYDSTVVRLHTDEGLIGHGEACPLGPAYLPAYAAGVRAGLRELAPHLIGQDPRQLGVINQVMDRHLKGHAYVKSALDIACWDLLGLASAVPVSTLMGGVQGVAVKCYRAISQDTPERMVARVEEVRGEGHHHFQIKVGSNPETDIARIRAVARSLKAHEVLVVDANAAWLPYQAARVIRAVEEIDFYLEQPCLGYAECLSIRTRTSRPLILDEIIDSPAMLLRAHADRAMDLVNIKLGKVGGLTVARQMRDMCVAMGLAMTIEDSGGSDIVTAAITHLAHSTPEQFRFSSSDVNGYNTKSIAANGPRHVDGWIKAPTAAGLGVEPLLEVLGPAVFSIGT